MDSHVATKTDQHLSDKPHAIPSYKRYNASAITPMRLWELNDGPTPPKASIGEHAKVWNVYLKEAQAFDDTMVKRLQDKIDSFLIFVALFSSVVTVFIVKTLPSLHIDHKHIHDALMAEHLEILGAQGNQTIINAIPSAMQSISLEPLTVDVWMNGLFLISLSISLITALVGLFFKRWLQSYSQRTCGNSRERALARQLKFTNFMKWRIPLLINKISFLIHVAIVFFLAGLSVLMASYFGFGFFSR